MGRSGEIVAEITVLGAGPGGLASAVGLAKAGHRVTVVERDEPPPDGSGEDAFDRWDRRSVPQFRQSHGFSARSHGLLADRIPEALDLLHDDGIREINFFKELAPRELWEPEDDRFTSIQSRRPAFELALRRAAEATDGVDFRCPAIAAGLIVEPGAPPTVRGLRLADGTELASDVLIDAGGRRSPIAAWLREHVDWPEALQSCESNYHTRYYRFRPGSTLAKSQMLLVAAGSGGDGWGIGGFPGDHDCFSISIFVPPWDDELKVVRQAWAWDAVVAAVPVVAPWVAPDEATPINDVSVMTGHRNVLREWVIDDRPVALGVLPVGDSLCTTNPMYGWGASMALTYAFAAVDAVADGGSDLDAIARRYAAAVTDEAAAVYRESSALDRRRIREWRGEPTPDDEVEEAERQSLLFEGVAQGATLDPVLGRAQLRRAHLIDRPGSTLDDPEVESRARRMRDKLAAREAANPPPTRAEILAAIDAARP